MKCRLCGNHAQRQFTLSVLGKHEVWYWLCDACGSLQTEEPYWLADAYPSNIAMSDVGAVDRCLTCRAVVWAVLKALGMRRERLLDFGGGSGLLCRLLRDVGIDAWTWDSHGSGDYAQSFRLDRMDQALRRFGVITAFEVFEHLAQPGAELSALFGLAPQVLIASTELYRPGAGRDWWYLSPSTGQHVFFYSTRALQDLAQRFGYDLHSQGGFHVFSRRHISTRARALLSLVLSARGRQLLRVVLEARPHGHHIAGDYQVSIALEAKQNANRREDAL